MGLGGGGNPLPIVTQTIDVGSAATDRSGTRTLRSTTAYSTRIDYNNAANGTGTMDTVKAWFNRADAGNSVKTGTFTDNGSGNFTCHDAESIGTVTAGSEQTYTGLSIDISNGEFIGADGRAEFFTALDADGDGGSGIYSATGQFCDALDSAAYTLGAGDILSLYGTGVESGGWANIAKVAGVTAVSMSKLNSVPIANIAKVNGIAV